MMINKAFLLVIASNLLIEKTFSMKLIHQGPFLEHFQQ